MLARIADHRARCSVAEEACPTTLRPRRAPPSALALGDALAMALLEVKGFRREDFAAFTPAARSAAS